jgi:lipoyl(octanoyl) transferase
VRELTGVMKRVEFQNLGRIRYKDAWDYQQKLFNLVLNEKIDMKGKEGLEGFSEKSLKQYLLFCEHEHVFTIGKSGNRQNLLIARHLCESRNIDLHEIDRGGDITYHGPGQLVVYPIIDLEEYGIGIKKYISMLEDVVIKTLKHLGLEGDKDEKAMGVWIDSKDPVKARKICAIGVRVSRFVTMHGLALNLNTRHYLTFIYWKRDCFILWRDHFNINQSLLTNQYFCWLNSSMGRSSLSLNSRHRQQ